MTDLERVRECLEMRMDGDYDTALEHLDAHLKEDAERDAAWHKAAQDFREGWDEFKKAEDELARLREDPPLRRALADEKAYAAELREQRDTLLAALKDLVEGPTVPARLEAMLAAIAENTFDLGPFDEDEV